MLEDGSQVGVQTTGTDSSAAPQLDPENPQVMVDGESLNAAPVTVTKICEQRRLP